MPTFDEYWDEASELIGKSGSRKNACKYFYGCGRASRDAEIAAIEAKLNKEIADLAHKVRQITACDPENIYCRQATIVLNEAYRAALEEKGE